MSPGWTIVDGRSSREMNSRAATKAAERRRWGRRQRIRVGGRGEWGQGRTLTWRGKVAHNYNRDGS